MGDLTVRRGERNINGEITTHTHTIVFAHPLSEREEFLFTRMIQGFYYTVHFSRQFGDGLVAEPVIEFTRPDEARYTLRQRRMSGAWKDLLLAMLANFLATRLWVSCSTTAAAFLTQHADRLSCLHRRKQSTRNRA